MMVTIAPADEACLALVDRINTGTAYALDVLAEYARVEVDCLEEINRLRVDVVADEQMRLQDCLDGSRGTIHRIVIWVRDKLRCESADEIAQRALIIAQIVQRVDNWDSSDRRVQVWSIDSEASQQPDKNALRQMGLFVASIVLNVKVTT